MLFDRGGKCCLIGEESIVLFLSVVFFVLLMTRFERTTSCDCSIKHTCQLMTCQLSSLHVVIGD